MFSLWIMALDKNEFLRNQGDDVDENEDTLLLSSWVLDLVLFLGVSVMVVEIYMIWKLRSLV